LVAPEISIVVPVFDEADAIPALVREIAQAFAGRLHEIIVVDDGSRDGTRAALVALKPRAPTLRILAHGRNAGQSRAIRSGALAARAPIVVTLDGDGQNDPADAPALVAALEGGPTLGMVGGQRLDRKDGVARRVASSLGNGVRRRILGDGAVDTGCGLRAFRREAYLRLPYFDHMHRFLPALFLREGYAVAYRPVHSRPRRFGVSKYSNLGRLFVSIWDMGGVIWLRTRARDPNGCAEL
jgi:dolichol-phosphate mannosyltransferase